MKTILFISASFFCLLLFSCGGGSSKSNNLSLERKTNNDQTYKELSDKNSSANGSLQSGNINTEDASSPQEPAEPDSTKTDPVIPTAKITAGTTSNIDWDKKIIKTAALNIEVKNFKTFNDNIHKTIHDFGGYVAQEEQNQLDDRLETTVSIKVPVAQFDALVNQLVDTGVIVKEKKISSEDVTGEVVDTKARLEAKKQMRLKYYDFLKQSRNIEEALQVQKEINDMQEDIEAADGRVDYLTHESAFSTINLTFFQALKEDFKPADTPVTFLSRVSNSFHSGAKWMGDVFVALMSIWPLFLIAIIIFIYFVKIRPAKQNVQKKL